MEKHISRSQSQSSWNAFAAEDIKEDSTVLEVICPELMPNSASGTLGAGLSSGNVTLQNRDGNPIVTSVNISNHIVATWGGKSNQRTPPLIRKGEPVRLFKQADQDKYYWEETGLGREFRKTDRMTFEVSAVSPDSAAKEKNDSNTYTGYVDSDKKAFALKTSMANGEVCSWSIGGDMANGTFHVSDNHPSGIPNRIFLDVGAVSGMPTMQLNLSTGVTVKLQDGDIYIKAPKRIFIDAGDRIVINSPLTIFNLSKAGVILLNAASVGINAAKDVILTAAAIGLNGATKCSSMFVSAAARIASITNGGAGSNYSGPTVSLPEESPVNVPSNSPDTTSTGLPYQT